MNIVFFCQSCGARFEVPSTSAGKRGRCKKCGQMMAIPQAAELASMVAMPALAAAGVGAGPRVEAAERVEAGAGAKGAGSWIATANSNVGLAPLTVDRLPLGFRKPAKPKWDEDLGDSKPYKLGEPVWKEPRGGSSGRPNVVVRLWKGQLGGIQKLFRKVNQFAYLISVPFLVALVVGAAVRSRPLALFSATAVVLLNIGRIVSGVANLAVIPLREGLNFAKMKKPLRRIIEPVLTIVLVVLAFAYIPWLSTRSSSKGGIAGRLRSSAETLEKEMEGQVEKAVDQAKTLDLQKIGTEAEERLKTIGPGSQAGGSGTSP